MAPPALCKHFDTKRFFPCRCAQISRFFRPSHPPSTANPRPEIAMKKILLAAALAAVLLTPAQAQLYWNTNGASATWTAANWGSSSAGPFTTAWATNTDVVFDATSAVTFASTRIGNITVNANTVVSQAGTLSTKVGGSTVTVADGVTLTWTSQSWSATATNQIWNKSGNGTWIMGANPNAANSSAASFTLNAGTVVASGNNSFGGINSLLTINGGAITLTSGPTIANTNIVIGGNFGLQGTTAAAYFVGSVSLGSATRTITNTASGNRAFSGNISASSASAGLTLAGTGTTTLGGTNTYTGNTTVTGGTLNLADNAQLRFTIGLNGTNNQLTQSGSAVVNLDGDFVFDLTGAGTTVGNSWTLTSGTINYNGLGGTFSVLSTAGAFTETFSGSGIWTRDENSVTYQFSELNSQLSVVPEPSTCAMLAIAAAGVAGHMVRRRRRQDQSA